MHRKKGLADFFLLSRIFAIEAGDFLDLVKINACYRPDFACQIVVHRQKLKNHP